MKTIIVIPTYNEAENLPRMANALFDLPLPDLEVLVVDDNSPDGTGKLADQLGDRNPGRLHVIHRRGKKGLGTAYITGFQWALTEGAQRVVQMDADFSHNPQKVPELLEELQEADLAVGSRYIPGGKLDENWPIWRRALSNFGNIYARTILRVEAEDLTGGFRAWRRETLAGLPLERVKSEGYAFQVEMIYLAHLLGYRIKEVPIYFEDRQEGDSKMSFAIQAEAALRVWQIWLENRDLRGRTRTNRKDKKN